MLKYTFHCTVLFILLAGLAWACGASNRGGSKSSPLIPVPSPLVCPPGTHRLRASSSYTFSDHAIACADIGGVWRGPYEERYADGHLAARGRYVDNQPDGQWVLYYPNGVKWKEGTFRNGKEEGMWTSYFDNGRKAAEGAYRSGARDGLWTEWYEDGTRRSEGNYRNSEETGRWTRWYPNGRVDAEGEYRGRRIVPPRNVSVPAEAGKWTYWYESGGKRLEGCFRDGDQVGTWIQWSEEGIVIERKIFSAAPDVECR